MKLLSRRAGSCLIALALVAATAFAYRNVGQNLFVNLDDDRYITNNPHVLDGLTGEGILWALSATEVANWHPVTWISHMVDISLFGMEAGRHHLVNLALHLMNALLLFTVFFRLTGKGWRSGLVAALFALHPLHVESVAWISERKDLLSGCCFFLTLLAYERYTRKPGPAAGLPVFLALATGLAAKPMLVTTPFVLLLLDFWPLRRMTPAGSPGEGARPVATLSRLVVEKIPLLALSVASCAVTVWAQGRSGTIVAMEALPFPARMGNAVMSYAAYLGKTIWPAGLAAYYPYPETASSSFMIAGVSVVLGISTVMVVRERVRRPWLATGWFWYLGMLVPVIGLIQAGGQAMADRYTYLPLTGIFIMAVWGVAESAIVRNDRRAAIGATCGAVAILAAFAWVTERQVGYWRDTGTLMTRALEKTSGNAVAHNNLALWLADQGRTDEAVSHHMEAIRLQPGDFVSYNNLGAELAGNGRHVEAIAMFRMALRLNPGSPEAHLNLATALENAGKIDEAIDHYREAGRLNPADRYGAERLGRLLAEGAGKKD